MGPGETRGVAPERFRSLGAIVLSYAWYLVAIFVVVDEVRLAHEGRGGDGQEVFFRLAVVAFVTAAVVALAHRPALLANDRGLTVRNVIRDVHIPWGRVDGFSTKWSLAVLLDTEPKVPVWAVPVKRPSARRSRRSPFAARVGVPVDEPQFEGPVTKRLRERWDAWRLSGPSPSESQRPVDRRIAWPVVAALLVTALALVVAIVLVATG